MQRKPSLQLHHLSLACSIALVTSGQQAAASGFAIPEISVAGQALSNAMVANPKDLGALPYNPSAMAFHEGSSLDLGVILVKPDLSVTTGNGSFDSDANDLVGVPTLSAHYTMTENMSIGLAVNAPFGLETDWPIETFIRTADNLGGYPAGTQAPTKTKLEVVDFSPALAYRINDHASISVGLDIYWIKNVVFNSKVNGVVTFPDVKLDGDGIDLGAHIGAMYTQGDWSLGINYHSSADIRIDGEIQSPTGNTEATARLELPSRLQIGIRNQTTEQLAIEFDFTRTGWSSFDTLTVKEDTFGTTVLTSINDWEDANAYRLGITYDLTAATQLRAGYTYDETPQNDEFFSPRIPDADRNLFSFGIGHELSNGWTINASYMYVKFDERSLESTRAVLPGEETNGTTAVNGDYEASVNLFGIGISKAFM